MSSLSAIDPRIQRLKLTTFFGKRLTRRQIADVQEMAASLPGLSRNELGKTVCEHLGWKTKRGRSRVRLAVRLLEELERLGVLSLPEKRRRRSATRRSATSTAILARAPADNPRWLWRGHRAFAVDGSQLNLPRPLLHNGYRTPSHSSHYPQGLLSCLLYWGE